MELTEDGKQEIALAIILWKDFKSDGRVDIEISKQAFSMAKYLGVLDQFNSLLSKVPPMKIVPRYE